MTERRCPNCNRVISETASFSCWTACSHEDWTRETQERKDAEIIALRERLAAAEAELADLRHFKATRTTHSTLKTRAETAEALVRELAAVVKAAKSIRRRQDLIEGGLPSVRFAHERGALGYDYDALDRALAALSPAARKEIEG